MRVRRRSHRVAVCVCVFLLAAVAAVAFLGPPFSLWPTTEPHNRAVSQEGAGVRDKSAESAAALGLMRVLALERHVKDVKDRLRAVNALFDDNKIRRTGEQRFVAEKPREDAVKAENSRVGDEGELRGAHEELRGRGDGPEGEGTREKVPGAHGDEAFDAKWRSRFGEKDAGKLRAYVEELNEVQHIRNAGKFSSRPLEGPVVVIQVHDRPHYFKHTIESLRKARGVEDALIVVSHDLWSRDMLEITWSVDFAQCVAIFMPHAMQLHPSSFPGTDPNDCPRDTPRDEARRRRCNNAEFPDQYGHYREAPFVMTKHHWWWKANFVFDRLRAVAGRSGPVLFLEGDHVVSPDIFETLSALYALRNSQCPDCGVMTLGLYTDGPSPTASTAETVAWRSSQHNMGMALDRGAWAAIAGCAREFCTYDDYNWDWSLQKLGTGCLSGTPLRGFVSLLVTLPRVFHIGSCGMHTGPGKDCDPTPLMAQLQGRFQLPEYAQAVCVGSREADGSCCDATGTRAWCVHTIWLTYTPAQPQTMRIVSSTMQRSAAHNIANGGWGDRRDHELCTREAGGFRP